MKPVVHNFVPFTVERTPSIRLNREIKLREWNVVKVKRAKAKAPKTTTTHTRKPKAVQLGPKAQAAMAAIGAIDPATRAILEQLMKEG